MKTPFKCPVCNGTKVVPNGFYNSTSGYYTTNSTTPEPCQSCNGTGIVWSEELPRSILFNTFDPSPSLLMNMESIVNMLTPINTIPINVEDKSKNNVE